MVKRLPGRQRATFAIDQALCKIELSCGSLSPRRGFGGHAISHVISHDARQSQAGPSVACVGATLSERMVHDFDLYTTLSGSDRLRT